MIRHNLYYSGFFLKKKKKTHKKLNECFELFCFSCNFTHNCSKYVSGIFAVYPQKQQYAYPGYPAPPAAYPGPYYHGSQYGPYNY